MNKSDLHKEKALSQSNASVIEHEEKNPEGSSMLPPELAFPAPKEETEELQEEVKVEEKQESAAASLQTADDDDSSSDSNTDTNPNGDSLPTLQLKNSTPKDQTNQGEKSQDSKVAQKQAAPQETEDQQDDVKATEQSKSTIPSKQAADDGASSDNNNNPNTTNGYGSNPFQLKKSPPKEKPETIPGYQVSETIQKQTEKPQKAGFELDETVQKQTEKPKISRFQLHQRKDGDGIAANGLPNWLNIKMAKAFKYDFSKVEIHTNSTKAKEVGAYAFAQGNEVHFAHGYYQPETKEGQELIGHELAHVKQQAEGRVKPTTTIEGTPTLEETPVNDDQALEKEADEQGKKAARGEDVGTSAINKGEKSDTLQGRFMGKLASSSKLKGGSTLLGGPRLIDTPKPVEDLKSLEANGLIDGAFNNIADAVGSELVEMPEAPIPEFTLNGSILDINLENVLDSQVLTVNLNINPIVTVVTAEITFYDGVYDSAKLSVKIASLPDSYFILYVDKEGKIDPNLTLDESIEVLGMTATVDAKVTNESVTGTLSVRISQPIQITESLRATEGELSLDLSLGGFFEGKIIVESNQGFLAGTADVEYDPTSSDWFGSASLSVQTPQDVEIVPGFFITIPEGVTLEFDFGYEGSSVEVSVPLSINVTAKSTESTLQAAGFAELNLTLGPEGVLVVPTYINLIVTGGLTTPDIDTPLSEQEFQTEVDSGASLELTFEENGALKSAYLIITGGFSNSEKRVGRIEYEGLVELNPFTLEGTLTAISEAELDIFKGEQFSLVMLINSQLFVYFDKEGVTAIDVSLALALKQQEEIIAQLELVGAMKNDEKFKISTTITLVKELTIIKATATQYGLSIRSGSTAGILFEDGALKQLDGTLGLGVQDTEGELLGGTYTGVIAFDEAQELSISEGTASLMLLRDIPMAVGTGRVTILKNAMVEASFEEGKLSTIKGQVSGTFEDRAFIIDISANLDYDMINQSITSLDAELTLEKDIELFKKEESFLTLNCITGSLIIKEDELIQIGGSGDLTGKFGTINLTGDAGLAWTNEGEEASFTGNGSLTLTKEATEGNPDKWFEGTLALSFAGSDFEASGEIKMSISKGLSGAASFHVDQEMDPTISATLEYTTTAMEGEELWAMENQIPAVFIPLWIFYLELGMGYGASLATKPLNIFGSIGIENWKPREEVFPHFDTQLDASWGVDFSTRLMLYAKLTLGPPYLNVAAGVEGGLGLDIPLEFKPLARLVGNDGGVGGEIAFNLTITPVFMGILNAFISWNILELVKGKEVWPIVEKELGNFADIHWEGSMKFGSEEALAASPAAKPTAPEQTIQPTSNPVPNIEGSLGYGNKELEESDSSSLVASGKEDNTVPNFFGEDSELTKILKRIEQLGDIVDALTNPAAALRVLLDFSKKILDDFLDFGQELVDKLEETGARFLRNPIGTVVKGVLGTAEDIVDGFVAVIEWFGDLFDFGGSSTTTYAFPPDLMLYWAIKLYGHESYIEYIKIFYDRHDKTVQEIGLPVKPYLEELIPGDPGLIAHVATRCAPGKTIQYAHPWETFEVIASHAYDDPRYKERLQAHNPTIGEVKEGDKVDIPTKQELGLLYEIEIPPAPVGNTGLTAQIRVEKMTVNQTSYLPYMTVLGSNVSEQKIVDIANSLIFSDSGRELYDFGRELKNYAQVWANDTIPTVKAQLQDASKYLNSLITKGALIIGGNQISGNFNGNLPAETTPLENAKPGDSILLGNHSLENVAEKVYGHKERAAWIKEYQTKAQASKPKGLSADAGLNAALTTAVPSIGTGEIITLPNWIDMAGMDALPLDKRGIAPQSKIKVKDSDTWSTLSVTAFGDWQKALALSTFSTNSGMKLNNGEEIVLPHPDTVKSSTVDIDELRKNGLVGQYTATELEDLATGNTTREILPGTQIEAQRGDTWSGLAEAAYGDFSLFPKLANYPANKHVQALIPGSIVTIPKKEDLDDVNPFSLGLSLNGYPLLTEMVRIQTANGLHHVWVEDRRDLATRTSNPFSPDSNDKPGIWMMASNPFDLARRVNELKEVTKGQDIHNHVLKVADMTEGKQTTSEIKKTKTSIQKLADKKLVAATADEAFEQELDDIEARYRKIIAWARGVGYNVAADNLERFLDGVGGLKTINSSWLRNQRKVREKEGNNRLWFQAILENFAREMEDGDSWEREHSFNGVIEADKKDGVIPSHLFYASGDSYFDANGRFSLNKKSNRVRMSGKVTNHWHDVYDWHAELSAHVPLIGTISDNDALLMRKHRGAKDFSMRSIWSQSVDGTIIYQEQPAGTRTSFDWDDIG